VQELHLVAVHMLCEAFDRAVERGEADRGGGARADGDTLGRPPAPARTAARPVDGTPVTLGKEQA